MLSKPDKITDIIWSPLKDDEFIAYGHDLYYCKVKHSKPTQGKLF